MNGSDHKYKDLWIRNEEFWVCASIFIEWYNMNGSNHIYKDLWIKNEEFWVWTPTHNLSYKVLFFLRGATNTWLNKGS